MRRVDLMRPIMLVALLAASACAFDAPRGEPGTSPGNFERAAQNFSRLSAVRVRVELADRSVIAGEARPPDTFVIVSNEGRVGADDAGRAVREALRVPGALAAATDRRYEEAEAVAAYLCYRWTFSLDGQRGKVWIERRDALPRRIQLTTAQGTVSFTYWDFNAALKVPTAGR